MSEAFLGGRVALNQGDCLEVLKAMPENSIDSCVTDPPYHLASIVKRFGQPNSAPVKLKKIDGQGGSPFARGAKGFMGKEWDGGDIAFKPDVWREVYRVLKPGAFLLAFSSSRTFGRMQVAIEDAGFITHPLIAELLASDTGIEDFIESLTDAQSEAFARILSRVGLGGMMGWIQGQGFPKAHRVHADGWEGWRYGAQALKPAIEPVYMGQKPFEKGLSGTENILKWGVGALNIDGCRVPLAPDADASQLRTMSRSQRTEDTSGQSWGLSKNGGDEPQVVRPDGRWPANVIHDGSEEVLQAFPDAPGQQFYVGPEHGDRPSRGVYGDFGPRPENPPRGDAGSAARFFYSPKADKDDRLGSSHPTVKPIDLIQNFVRLITPPGGTVLDCFAGTGTTGEAAFREGMNAVLIEREPEYIEDIKRRMALVLAGPDERKRESIKAKSSGKTIDPGPLFGGDAA